MRSSQGCAFECGIVNCEGMVVVSKAGGAINMNCKYRANHYSKNMNGGDVVADDDWRKGVMHHERCKEGHENNRDATTTTNASTSHALHQRFTLHQVSIIFSIMRMTPTLTSLPPEVLYSILSHLSARDLCNIAAVSTTLQQAANTPALWHSFAPNSHNPKHDYLVSCAWRSARPLLTQTRLLSSFQPPQMHASQVPVNLTRFPVQCINLESEGFMTVGSTGGEVVRVKLGTTEKRFYVGPCSCPVTAVRVNEEVVIAGFAHCVPGNGHNSGAVAWDRDSGHRLAAFGGGVARSSWAFPTAAVRDVVVSKHRVGLVCGNGVVRIYEIGNWRCLMEIGVGQIVKMDMDDSKIGIIVLEDGAHVLHMFDFEKALTRWPMQLERI